MTPVEVHIIRSTAAVAVIGPQKLSSLVVSKLGNDSIQLLGRTYPIGIVLIAESRACTLHRCQTVFGVIAVSVSPVIDQISCSIIQISGRGDLIPTVGACRIETGAGLIRGFAR